MCEALMRYVSCYHYHDKNRNILFAIYLCYIPLKKGFNMCRSTCHFMDKTESEKESSEESTRESLIALSHCLPDSPKPSAKKLSSGLAIKDSNGDEAETHRSKLISISNKQSSDSKAGPLPPCA